MGVVSAALAGRKLVHSPRPGRVEELGSSPPELPPAPEPDPDLLVQEPVPAPSRREPVVVKPAPLTLEEEYAEFLASLGLRHLTPEEIICPHRNICRGVANKLPPKKLWAKLAPTLKVADELRERLGVPLERITSAYRAPRYNLQIPGASRRSYHTRNQALDLVFACPASEAVAMARRLRNDRFFRGGIGVYPTFVHIDTRGYNANWRG